MLVEVEADSLDEAVADADELKDADCVFSAVDETSPDAVIETDATPETVNVPRPESLGVFVDTIEAVTLTDEDAEELAETDLPGLIEIDAEDKAVFTADSEDVALTEGVSEAYPVGEGDSVADGNAVATAVSELELDALTCSVGLESVVNEFGGLGEGEEEDESEAKGLADVDAEETNERVDDNVNTPVSVTTGVSVFVADETGVEDDELVVLGDCEAINDEDEEPEDVTVEERLFMKVDVAELDELEDPVADAEDDDELVLDAVELAVDIPDTDTVEVSVPGMLATLVGEPTLDAELMDEDDPVADDVAELEGNAELVLDAVALAEDELDTVDVEVAVPVVLTRLVGDTALDAELTELADAVADDVAEPEDDDELELDAVELADDVLDFVAVEVAEPVVLTRLDGDAALDAELTELADPIADGVADADEADELVLDAVRLSTGEPDTDVMGLIVPVTLNRLVGDADSDIEVTELAEPLADNVAEPDEDDELVPAAVELADGVLDVVAVEVPVLETLSRLVAENVLVAELLELGDPGADNVAEPDDDDELELDAVELTIVVPDTDTVEVPIPDKLTRLVGDTVVDAELSELKDPVPDDVAEPDDVDELELELVELAVVVSNIEAVEITDPDTLTRLVCVAALVRVL